MTRRTKIAAVVMLVVGVQVVTVLVYQRTEERRAVTVATILPTTPPIVSEARIETLWVADRGGFRTDLGALTEPTVVHFWATWCPPCVTELPALLAASDAAGLPTLAVSLDDSWVVVDQLRKHPNIRRLENKSAAASALDLQTLPVTLLVGRDGRVLLRADGARDWTDPAFVASWRAGSP